MKRSQKNEEKTDQKRHLNRLKHCLRCDWTWFSRLPGRQQPKFCPSFKSPYWNRPRKREDVELIQEITELR